MKDILVIRLTAIGDVILTLPAISVLRRNFPAAKISFLTTSQNSELLRGFSDVADTIILNHAAFRGKNPFRAGGELLSLVRRLRAGGFSLAVDLQANGESGWLARLSGAPRRWGIAKKPSRRWAYTSTIDPVPLHPAETYCHLLQHCGLDTSVSRNEFHLSADAREAAQKLLAGNGLSLSRPTLYTQPFTSAAHKNWPLDNYLAIARYWRERGIQIVFGGGPGDIAPLRAAAAEGFCVTAGVPLLVTAGLLQQSTLILGGDTGMLHLAVALGKRVLMLMHDARPGSPTPFQHNDWAIAVTGARGINGITVTQVNAALEPHLTSR